MFLVRPSAGPGQQASAAQEGGKGGGSDSRFLPLFSSPSTEGLEPLPSMEPRLEPSADPLDLTGPPWLLWLALGALPSDGVAGGGASATAVPGVTSMPGILSPSTCSDSRTVA